MESALATTQDFFEEGDDPAKDQSNTNPLEFEKKELDSLLDNLMD